MPPLFRETPPIELVNRCVQTLGLNGITDATWFSKQHIRLDALSELLPELEPYYVPCKAGEFLHPPLTPSRAITVIRHILRVHNAQLLTTEKARGGSKTIWYQVLTNEMPASMEISFD